MFAQQARFLLNDENVTPRAPPASLSSQEAPSPLNIGSPASVHASPRAHQKPRVGGIGRAPSRRSGASSASGTGSASNGAGGGGVHGLKPYARSASNSVTRAKHSANKASKARKAPPPPVQIPPAGRDNVGASSSSSTAANASNAERGTRPKITQIPLRLPRPVFPPVYCKMPGLLGVPSQYIVDRLTPLLPSFLITCALFRPMPELNPTIPSDRLCNNSIESPSRDVRPKTMTFGIPQLMNGNEDESLRSKIAGREPDLCLAVSGKKGGPARLIPINQVVYAAQCAHWPSAFLRQPATGVSAAGVRPSRELSVPASDSTSVLQTIEEEMIDEEIRAQAHAESPASDPDDAMQQDGSISPEPSAPADEAPTRGPGDPITLPIMHLKVPSVDDFLLIHKHLHLPMRSLVPQLLSLKNSSTPRCPPPGQIFEELRAMEMPDLRDRLQTIHGVWKNLSALGFGTERTWQDMGDAWAHLVSMVALKEATPPARTPPTAAPRS